MFITFTAQDRTSGIHWTKVWMSPGATMKRKVGNIFPGN
jgi:hypothetical protein